MNFSSPGLLWPGPVNPNVAFGGVSSATSTLNAAGLRLGFFGRVFIYGSPTGTKTISSGGGGSLSYRTGAVTLSNGSTNLDFGLQGVSTSAGPAAQADGTYTTKMSYTSAGTKPTANAWNTAVMTSGTQSIAHGDLIAVVWDMTARGGTDSVVVNCANGTAQQSTPLVNSYNGTIWSTTSNALHPNILITFDDGTLATLDCSVPFTSVAGEAFQASTNPNERGILFQVPGDCYVDALWAYLSVPDGSAGLTLGLYQNPIGGQSSMTTIAVDPHTLGGTSTRFVLATLPAANIQLLRANSEYGVALLATGTSNVTMQAATVNAVAHWQLWPGGSSGLSVGGNRLLEKIARNGSSGNFSATTTTTYSMGVRISSFLYSNQLINSGGLIG